MIPAESSWLDFAVQHFPVLSNPGKHAGSCVNHQGNHHEVSAFSAAGLCG